jgi:hypothetical protein
MIVRIVSTAALAGLVALTSTARAQQAMPGPATGSTLMQFTPYVGYMAFGDFLRGPVGSTLSVKNAPLFGAQVGMKVAPNVSVIGNVAYSSTDLQVGIPFLGGMGVGSAGVWLYDGGVQVDFPISAAEGRSPITPFVQAGVGAATYKVKAANILNTNSTNFAFNGGIGLDYQVTPTVGVRLMAKDYIGKFDFKDATSLNIQGRTAHNWALTGGIKIGF